MALSERLFIAVTATFGFIGLLTLITCCIMAFYTWKFYQLKYSKIDRYKQRYGRITVYESFFTILNMILTVISMGVYMYTYDYVTQYVIHVLYQESIIILFAIWILRFWLLRYKMIWNIATAQNYWIRYIDPTQQIESKYSWFIDKYQTLGVYESKTIWMVFIVCNILCIIYFILSSFTFYHFFVINTWLTFVSIISYSIIQYILFFILVYLYFTIPPFEDTFFVKKELKLLLMAISLWILAFLVVNVFWFYTYFKNHTKTYDIPNVLQVIIAISKFSATMISTHWVLSQLNKTVDNQHIANNRIELQSTNAREHTSLLRMAKNGADTLSNDKLKSILADKNKFEIYMVYLSKETSVPLLLAFVELIQFQKFVSKRHQQIDIDIDEAIEFYEEIPESQIVFGNNDDKDEDNLELKIMKKADELFKRYFGFGYNSDLELKEELEIASRNDIDDKFSDINWMRNLDINAIMALFNTACNELWQKLLDAFESFKRTTQYEEMNKLQYYSVNEQI